MYLSWSFIGQPIDVDISMMLFDGLISTLLIKGGRRSLWSWSWLEVLWIDVFWSIFQLNRIWYWSGSLPGESPSEYTYMSDRGRLWSWWIVGVTGILSDKEKVIIKYSSEYKNIMEIIMNKNSKICTDNPITRKLVKDCY